VVQRQEIVPVIQEGATAMDRIFPERRQAPADETGAA
jgi:hypothetical protein